MFADSQKQQAIFVIHSYSHAITTEEDALIDKVTILKVVLGGDDNLSY
jgi:hypothetical protein